MNNYTRMLLAGVMALLLGLSYSGITAIYIYSVYEAVTLNGWMGAFVAIPFLGQLLWAGVKFYSHGFFSTYFYLIYATLALFGLGSLISAFVTDKLEGS